MKNNNIGTWHKDPRNRFEIDKTQKHISATYFINDIEVRGKFCKTDDGHYRGEVKLISPEDGKVYQIQGAARKEKLKEINTKRENKKLPQIDTSKRYVGLEAKKSKYPKTIDEAKIAIVEAATDLYKENFGHLNKLLSASPNTASSYPIIYVQRFGTEFVNERYPNANEKTRQQHKKRIERAFGLLSSNSLFSISKNDIEKMLAVLHSNVASEKTKRADIKMFSEFWDYCDSKIHIGRDNPFSNYISKRMSRSAPEKLQLQAMKPSSLPKEIQTSLYEIINNEVQTNGKIIGLLLLFCAGITPAKSCKLHWSDVVYLNHYYFDITSIALQNNDLVAYTHNFTRPLDPFAAKCIKDRLNELSHKFSEREILKMPIVSDSKDPCKPVEASELTSYIKRILLKCRISYSTLKDNEKSIWSSAVSILLANYKYQLKHDCGLANDEAAVRYLMGCSLAGDTTADNYRNFSGPDGQYYAYRALERKVPISLMPDFPNIPNNNTFSRHEKISTENKDRIVGAHCELKLKKNEKVLIKCQKGLSAVITARVLDSNGNAKRASKRDHKRLIA